ncbi:hypothetical protein ACSZNG_11815 [Aeromonas hydrophila]|uniref:hypothetical protein n=1 Tax=Aeromonas hydrophila TaxID=644 RepID=UPI001FEE895C|nr:hypothetical protein [Aeromonas hydrophila]
MPGFVGFPYMHGAGVSVRVEGDGVNAEAPGCLDDAHGDFAAIGDQQALDWSVMGHAGSLLFKAHKCEAC